MLIFSSVSSPATARSVAVIKRMVPAVVVAGLVASCGATSTDGRVAPASADTESVSSSVFAAIQLSDVSPSNILVQNTIPSLAERNPWLFDSNGCEVVTPLPAFDSIPDELRNAILDSLPDDVRATVRATGSVPAGFNPSKETIALINKARTTIVDCSFRGETPLNPHEFYGYQGYRYAATPADVDGIAEKTLTISSVDGVWSSQGLVVAGKHDAPVDLIVHGILRDKTGAVLSKVEARAGVSGLRSGEPSPFRAITDVPFDQVSDVTWTVTSGTATMDANLLEIVIENVHYGESTDVAGLVINRSDRAVTNPRAIVVAFDAVGRVIFWEHVDVVEVGTSEQLSTLEPGLLGAIYAHIPIDGRENAPEFEYYARVER